MSEPSRLPIEARIANVSAALVYGAPPGDDARSSDAPGGSADPAADVLGLLATLFEELFVMGGAPRPGAPGRRVTLSDDAASPLARVAAALEAASEERVLVVHAGQPDVNAALLLALTAWPEQAIVAPREGERVVLGCAIYRREDVLPEARRLLAEGSGELEALAAACSCGYLEGDDLAALA